MDNPKIHIITSIMAFVFSMALAYAADVPILFLLGLLNIWYTMVTLYPSNFCLKRNLFMILLVR